MLNMYKLLIIIISVSLILFFWPPKYYYGKKSDHFDGTKFFDPNIKHKPSFWKFLKWKVLDSKANWPDSVDSINSIPQNRVYGNKIVVTNVGHTTFLIQTQGINILTDPVWSQRASPVSWAGPKRVSTPGIIFDDLPDIDVIWISHNHYDHLDLKTIEKLWKKYKPKIITPLGNDTIIKNYNPDIDVEAYDWGDSVEITKTIKMHLSPMQHWSARGLFDHNRALWAAVTIETPAGNIYFVGDSGYGTGRYFKQDYKKFGSYLLAILPMGAYEPRNFMKYQHMNPEEMVKAHIDLNAKNTIPCHYDVFQLTNEPFTDAIIKLKNAMKKHNINNIHVLNIGEVWTNN